MKRSLSSPLLLLFPALLALASCEKKAEPVTDPDAETLQSLHAAANNDGYCRALAAQPDPHGIAKQDAIDAAKRLAVLERRALDAGVSGTKIDAEIASGQNDGQESAKKTVEERAARKAAEAQEDKDEQ